jgi:ligand-binding sensor protein
MPISATLNLRSKDMQLTDICPLSTWETLENEIFTRFKFQGSVFNTDGIRITDVKNWSNQLCPAIKSTEKGQSYICSVAHMNMTAMVKNSETPAVEECDAGFTKVVVPIFANDEFLGVAGGCGLILEENEVDTFAVTKIADIPENEVTPLAKDLPTISQKTLDEAVAFIQDQVDELVTAYQERAAGK